MFLSLLTLALAAQPAPAPEVKTAKPKVQCRSEIATGTRIGRKRVCASTAEWDNKRQEQLDSMAQDRARASNNTRPCSSFPCR
jgi:hypothetical protein